MGEPRLLEWLELREPADVAARSIVLTEVVAAHLERRRGAGGIRVLDLGTGRGSNIRFLAPRLPMPQHWLAVDKNLEVLGEATSRVSGITIETKRLDVGGLNRPEIFAGRHLVTASALLDLVSAEWLQWVAGQCRSTQALVLFAITYNGVNICTPEDPDDGMVLALFDQHQRQDKGLGGRAAGPGATDAARLAFEMEGYSVQVEPSDWRLGPSDAELQSTLIDGWAFAATEMAPERLPTIEAWRERRQMHVSAGTSEIVVGHDDFAAWLPESRLHQNGAAALR